MNNLKLNETPIRTSRNFNINNIKLEDIEIPDTINKFNNITITGDSSLISNNTSNIKLTYGIEEELINQIKEHSNIELEINCIEYEKIQADFNFDESNPTLLENIEIIASENSKSTIILKYKAQDDLEYWHNGLIRVNAKKDSEINIILVNLLNMKSNNFMSIENNIEENAKVKYTIIDFGGRNSITNYYSNIIGENSDNTINTIYLGKENQLFDLNYIGELRGKKSNIDIEVQGALIDKAKKHFKGTINFKKGCKKATGNENESCMLLSDTAKSLALPMLLCSEEDVEGNHSSSAGKIGEKELFYIMSRGFKLKEAMKLMVRAKFNKILENIDNEGLKEEIIYEIDKRLD
ncbi:MAG: SufD family Fe-S cluster assembly protein [Clostridia bacterium]|nr:SufD family Fe-S cluster assembly protein [Clostridia bacterium]